MRNTPIKEPVLIIVGPTAIGKTELSIELAERFNCEIISVDSMQVYRFMNIGTAKVSIEERALVPHHLIDIVDPDEEYNAAQFRIDCVKAIDDIHRRGKIPLLTGGTGLYYQSLLGGVHQEIPSDPDIKIKLLKRLSEEGTYNLHKELRAVDSVTAERVHENDSQRIVRGLEVFQISGKKWSDFLAEHKLSKKPLLDTCLCLGLTMDRNDLYQRINLRCQIMFAEGLEDEVRSLLARGYSENLKSMNSIGYRHMVSHINSLWDLDETLELVARDTRRYAKRQYTWFKKMDEIIWVEKGATDVIINHINNFL